MIPAPWTRASTSIHVVRLNLPPFPTKILSHNVSPARGCEGFLTRHTCMDETHLASSSRLIAMTGPRHTPQHSTAQHIRTDPRHPSRTSNPNTRWTSKVEHTISKPREHEASTSIQSTQLKNKSLTPHQQNLFSLSKKKQNPRDPLATRKKPSLPQTKTQKGNRTRDVHT